MTLDRFRPYVAFLLRPLVHLCIRAGIRPDFFSILAFLGAIAAGFAFYFGQIGPAVLLVLLNAVSDSLDGALARALKQESRRGDFLDHVFDRYADIFIITGIFAGGIVAWQVGVFALVGVLMSSYMGTQAQAVGVGRYYGGILGRADRLVLIMVAGGLDLTPLVRPFSVTYLGWLLVIFGVLGNVTAIQRFVYIWKQLR